MAAANAPAPLALADVHRGRPAEAERLFAAASFYNLCDFLAINPNNVGNNLAAGAIGAGHKSENQVAYELVLRCASKVMIIYVNGDHLAQVIPFGDGLSLLTMIMDNVAENERISKITQALHAAYSKCDAIVRSMACDHLVACCAQLEHHSEDVAHMKRHLKCERPLANNRGVAAAGRMYLDYEVYKKNHVMNCIFTVTYLALAFSKINDVYQPGLVNDNKQFEYVRKEFIKVLYSNYHTHRDLCRLTPYEKTFLRTSKVLHPEAEVITREKNTQNGAQSFFQYFYFVHVFKDLKPFRNKDPESICDYIPDDFKRSFSSVIAEVDEVPAGAPVRRDRNEPKQANKQQQPAAPTNGAAAPPARVKTDFFPGNSKGEWNEFLKQLSLPKDKQSAFYRQCEKEKLLPGFTGGVVDQQKIRDALAKFNLAV